MSPRSNTKNLHYWKGPNIMITAEIELTDTQLEGIVGGCHRHEEWSDDRDDEESEERRGFRFSRRSHRSSLLDLELLGERDEDVRGIL
jgi:hypothetical protein